MGCCWCLFAVVYLVVYSLHSLGYSVSLCCCLVGFYAVVAFVFGRTCVVCCIVYCGVCTAWGSGYFLFVGV